MIDKHSDTWKEVSTWAMIELVKATERIETLGVEADETENLRGKIAMFRELLALQEKPKERVMEPVEDYGFMGIDEQMQGVS